MRRPVRPFTIERKRGARAAPTSDTLVLEPPTPFVTPLPEPPRQWAPEPTRWAAAEALFSIPPADAPEPALGEPTQSRRILPSLNEPAAPAYIFEEAPKRRGRKPGSRNKPRAAPETQGPKTIDTVVRNVFALWAQGEVAYDALDAPEAVLTVAAIVQNASATLVDAPPLALSRRGRLVRADLPRGVRWQARLPRFAR